MLLSSDGGLHRRQLGRGSDNPFLAGVAPNYFKMAAHTEAGLAQLSPQGLRAGLPTGKLGGDPTVVHPLDERIVGSQLDFSLDSFDSGPTAPVLHSIQRKSLLVRLPLGSEGFADDIPAQITDPHGNACLIVLPSDRPSSRQEAVAVEQLLAELLAHPSRAARRACMWRANILSSLCADALNSLVSAIRAGNVEPEQSWQFKALGKQLTQRVLGHTLPGPTADDEHAAHVSMQISSAIGVAPEGAAKGGQAVAPKATAVAGLAAVPKAAAAVVSPRIVAAAFAPPAAIAEGAASMADAGADAPGDAGDGDRQDAGAAAETSATAAQAPGSGGSNGLQGRSVESLYGLTLGTSIAMADVIRQVEVHCGERGRLLAQLWNCHISTLEGSLAELRRANEGLREQSDAIRADHERMTKEMKGLEFLRREVMRFRRGLEGAEQENAKLSDASKALQSSVEARDAQLQALEEYMDKRLARLRWRHGAAVIGTRTREVAYQSGGFLKRCPEQLQARVDAVERLAAAVKDAEKRRDTFGRSKDPEKFRKMYSSVAEVAMTTMMPVLVSMPGMSGGGAPSKESYASQLSNLTPEARTMLLASLPEAQRWPIMAAMSDLERAEVVIAMSAPMRAAAEAAMGQQLWARTLEVLKQHSPQAARYLFSMTPEEAVAEFVQWNTFAQLDTLAALDGMTASKILALLSPDVRRELLQMLEPAVAANIMQCMSPPPAADNLEGMATKYSVNIFNNMDPDKAAMVMAELSSIAAAENLMQMNTDGRTTIMESMPPGKTAGVVAEMDGISQAAGASIISTQMIQNLQPTAALRVMSYMSIQEKAALLAAMESAKAAEILALIDSNEAVLILAALGDYSGQVVAQALPLDERQRLIKVLNSAGSSTGSSGGRNRKGAVQVQSKTALGKSGGGSSGKADLNQDNIARIKGAYAGLQEQSSEQWLGGQGSASNPASRSESPFPDAVDQASKTRGYKSSGKRASYDTATADADEDNGDDEHNGDEDSGAAGGTGTPGGGRPAANGRNRAHLPRSDSTGYAENDLAGGTGDEGDFETGSEYDDAGELAGQESSGTGIGIGGGGGGSGGATASGRGAPGRGKPPRGGGAAGGGSSGNAARAVAAAAGKRDAGSKKPGVAANRPKPRNAGGGRGSGTGDATADRGGGDDDDDAGSGESGDDLVGALPPGEEGGGGGGRRGGLGVRSSGSNMDANGGESGGSTPRKRRVSMSNIPKAALTNLRGAVASKVRNDAARHGGDGDGDDPQSAPTPAAVPEPQSKLGRLPKNARLIEAMAQHKHAKPKPKGWLLSVVDSIYKDAETLQRKFGRGELLKRQSVPEICFAYFHNKYGQRALVDEYVGSLVNTLTLYKKSDLRLEAFARLLSEEWDMTVFLDFLAATGLCIGPGKVPCVEYPREPGRDEQYAWVCLYKAINVADTIIGPRSAPLRDSFNALLQEASDPADEADVERVRRERREALAKEGQRTAPDNLPDKFYKLPRIRFLIIFCNELSRINRCMTKAVGDCFHAADAHHAGKLSPADVRAFAAKALPAGSGDQAVAELVSAILAQAEATIKDVLPEQVAPDSVKEVTEEGFLAACCTLPALRDYLKQEAIPSAEAEAEGGSSMYQALLGVIAERHGGCGLMALWQRQLGGSEKAGPLLAALEAAAGGDARLRAYVNLLVTLISMSAKAALDADPTSDQLNPEEVDAQLCRLEDAALLVSQRLEYIVEASSPEVAAARMKRAASATHVRLLAADLQTYRHAKDSMRNNAAQVVQTVWRNHVVRKRTAG